MTKILIFSDSHYNTTLMEQVVEKLHHHIDYVFHLGDMSGDLASIMRKYPNLRYAQVAGNCDFKTTVPQDQFQTIEGKKIFLCHGHRFHVKNTMDSLVYYAQQEEVDIALFGHTHEYTIFDENNIYFMNPGSISLPRGTVYRSYGIIDLAEDQPIHMSVVGIDGAGTKILKTV